jgi:glycosyltransferase involved in cell wall biosynthesis
VIATIQGLFSLYPNIDKNVTEERMRLLLEEKIIRKLKYFGLAGEYAADFIKSINPNAQIFRYNCPYAKTIIDYYPKKQYDLIYFATLAKMKGIEDLIIAISIIKSQKPDISLCVIGRGEDDYCNYLNEWIKHLKLERHIIFKGFFNNQEELHNEVAKSRISVLPTYNDRMPGTIVESMMLGVPVISYKVGGVPDFNKSQENIILVERGNIENLAKEIMRLLDDPERQKKLAGKARNYALVEFENSNSINTQVQAYRKIIQDFHNKLS